MKGTLSVATERRKVAIYVPHFECGGAEIVSVRLANEFATIGHDVTIIATSAEGPLRGDVAADVRVLDLGVSRTLAAIPKLIAYLKGERPAIFISGLVYNNIAALIAKLVSRWNGHLFVCQHCTFSIEATQNVRDLVHSVLLAVLMRAADTIVAVSTGVADDLARYGLQSRRRISVIYNPIITRDFDQRAAVRTDHAWLDQAEEPVFVAVGRLHKQKDYPTLLRAFALARQSVKVRLMILGEGPLLGELQALATELGIAEHVTFAGFRSNPLPFMRAAKALVLSSSYEGFGNVLAEALACGTPVISTRCNGPLEILGDGAFGTLVPIGEPDALAEAIVTVAGQQPTDPQSLRRSAERFKVERIAEQYLSHAGGRV
jgi:glycosyltransferase involved in cell wall biosynthesis